jgi:hypothetical protein
MRVRKTFLDNTRISGSEPVDARAGEKVDYRSRIFLICASHIERA